MKKLSLILTCMICSITTAYSATEYEIEAINSMEDILIINGEKFEAKTYCPRFSEGDRVIFIDGDTNGICVSAEIYNKDLKDTCSLWCP